MARLVEQAILHDMSQGSVVAWKFLAAHHVPTHIIMRVLGDPLQRRMSDTPGDGTSPSNPWGPNGPASNK